MKEKYYTRLGVFIFFIVLSLIISNKCSAQIFVTEFNACWNQENTIDWLDSLQVCDIAKVEIDRIGKRKLQELHNITVVPTLIIFKDGIEVKRFLADISFTLKTRKEEVQSFIDSLYNDEVKIIE